MNSYRLFLLAVILPALLVTPTRAHFLFVRIPAAAEGGRAAEVYFSELAEAGDPRFLGKIASTQLWLQTTPGRFEVLKVHRALDRLRAWVPSTGSLMVIGACRYGVLGRPGQTAFLLRHYPKALAGNAEELNQLRPYRNLPLEVVVSFTGAGLRMSAMRDGRPVPGAEFVTIDARLNNVKLKADAEGNATWQPPAPGEYAVYTRYTSKEAGEFGGKKYGEIRDFATVAFTWPLERTDADPPAVARFEEALAARAAWQHFPGFTARVAGNFDGRHFTGEVTVDAGGKAAFTDDDPSRSEAVSPWLEEQLESIAMHRIARPPSAGAARPVLRFGESREDHPLGRLLVIDGGKFASSYRVKDRQILVVNRQRGKENMTITVLDNDRNAEGQFLPRSYTVQYWEASTGALKRTETVQDRWRRLRAWDLPERHIVTTATSAGLSVRSFTLSGHEMAKGQ
jgi:hypothetical protein